MTYKIQTRNGLLGDSATEYWSDEDHENWRQAVNKMKADGTYMQPVTYHMELVPNSNYDSNAPAITIESSKFTILDFGIGN